MIPHPLKTPDSMKFPCGLAFVVRNGYLKRVCGLRIHHSFSQHVGKIQIREGIHLRFHDWFIMDDGRKSSFRTCVEFHDWFIMDDRHEEERHHKTPDSMKFPCGLMCLSFLAAIPHRAVVTVLIHWGADTRGWGRKSFAVTPCPFVGLFIEEQTREVLGCLLFFNVTMIVSTWLVSCVLLCRFLACVITTDNGLCIGSNNFIDADKPHGWAIYRKYQSRA
jgi:hypothetical protein